MNFFFCNRCNKKYEDNILYLNSTEIMNKNKDINYNYSDSNIINQADTTEKYLQINNQNLYDINIKDLEEQEDSEDSFKIIDYPYTKQNKVKPTKIKPKNFNINKNKYNDNELSERYVLDKIYYLENNKNSKKLINNNNKITNIKYKLKSNKNNNKLNANHNSIEKKDTITDPSNLALFSLIYDINKVKINPTKNKNKNNINKYIKDIQEDINTIENDNFFMINKIKENKKLKPQSSFQNRNRTQKNDNIKFQNKNNLTNKSNINNSLKKKCNEYGNYIAKKKNILKNKVISNNNNFEVGNSKNKFSKSNSTNLFVKKKNKLNNKIENEINKNIFNTQCGNKNKFIFKNILQL